MRICGVNEVFKEFVYIDAVVKYDLEKTCFPAHVRNGYNATFWFKYHDTLPLCKKLFYIHCKKSYP